MCQSDTYEADPQTGIARLQRFKWGMCAALILSPTNLTPFLTYTPAQIINCRHFDAFIPSLPQHRYHYGPPPFSGRMLMETPRLPTIVPMWITGAFPSSPMFLHPHKEALMKATLALSHHETPPSHYIPQASTGSCQKAAAHHGSSSLVPAPA